MNCLHKRIHTLDNKFAFGGQKYVQGVNLYIPKIPEKKQIAAINMSYTRRTR